MVSHRIKAKKTSGFPKLFVTDLDDTALGGGYVPYARFPDPFSEFLIFKVETVYFQS